MKVCECVCVDLALDLTERKNEKIALRDESLPAGDESKLRMKMSSCALEVEHKKESKMIIGGSGASRTS